MTPRFQERHQDYVLKMEHLGAGEIRTAVPLLLDLDAPFVLRSRAFRVSPSQPSPSTNLQDNLQFLKTSFTGPDENYVSQQRVPATLHSYCFGQQGSPTPVFPQMIYPAGGVIYVDLENTGANAITNLRLYFRGVKLYAWGSRQAVTYPARHGAIRPFCYPVVAPQLAVTQTAPLVVTLIVQPDADFVLRGGRAGTGENDYFEVEITLRDSDGKPYSNLPVHASVLFGRPAEWGFVPFESFGVFGESYPCGSLVDGVFAVFCGPSNPGLLYPEIYLQRNQFMYLEFTRDDAGYANQFPLDFPVLLTGVKVLP